MGGMGDMDGMHDKGGTDSSGMDGMDHMQMWCGIMGCPTSKKFMEENEKMHKAMAVFFTCDAAVDFVRGMVPHHQGAVEMCHVLLQANSMTDSGLVHFCEHVIAEQ